MGAGQIPKRTGQAVTTASVTTLADNACTLSEFGIVVALPEELRTLTSHKIQQGECFQLGTLWIAHSGAGWQNAEAAARLLIGKGVKGLISWGCAAGLSHTVKPGNLVLASCIVSDNQAFDTDTLWREHLQQQLSALNDTHMGWLFTSKKLISSSLLKQQISQQSQAIALDMESAAIADVAKNANLPCLAIRSIADPVDQDLPLAVLNSLNADGQVELPRLFRHLFLHPWELNGLIRLGRHFHAAQKTLKTVARLLNLHQLRIAT